MTTLTARGFTVQEETPNGKIRVEDKAGGWADIRNPAEGVTTVTSSEGRVHTLNHDPQGRLSSIADPAGFQVRFDHDEKDRLTAVHRGESNTHRFLFDDAGRLSSIMFPDGANTRYAYDPAGRLRAVADRNRRITKYDYSPAGRLTSITDWQGSQTQFEYAEAPLPIATVLPTGDRVEYRIDAATGRASRSINGVEQVAFEQTEPGLHTVRAADGTQCTLRLKDGRIVEATNEHGTVKLAYDPAGRLTMEEFNGRAVEFQRNPIGALTAIVTPDGEELKFERDTEARLTRVVDWNQAAYRFDYDKSGALAAIRYPNAAELRMTATPVGLPSSLSVSTPGSSRPVFECRWENDERDRVTQWFTAGQAHHYLYDAEGRLTAEHSTGGRHSERYLLDPSGNRVEDATGPCTVNSLNQLTARAGSAYLYDLRGNMTVGPCPNGNARYSYDGLDRMTAVETASGAVRYHYDALGRRIRKIAGNRVTHFTWAGDQLLSEVTVENGKEKRRDYLPLAELRAMLAMREDGATYYFHNGRRGEPLLLTGARAEVVWSATYTAFGICQEQVNKIRQPWRLAGQYFDEETGLSYVLARYYNPELGRFLSADPLAHESGTLNFYTYGDGDPINRIDPSGEIAPLVVIGIIALGAVIGAAIGGGIEAYKQSKQNPGQPLDWGAIGKEAAIGAAVGAIGAAVGIVLAPVEAAAAGALAVLAAGAATGGIGAAVEHCAEMTLRGQSISASNLLTDVLIGAAVGAVTAGVGGLLARRARRLAQEADELKKLEELKKLQELEELKKLDELKKLEEAKKLEELKKLEEQALEQAAREAIRKELEEIAAKRAAELKRTMSNKARGPVLTVLKDKKTGQVFEGINKDFVPDDLHPILKERLANMPQPPPHPSLPGSHSEIMAMDQALKAREAAGMKVSDEDLKDFVLYNETLYRNRTGSVPCCANCSSLTDGVDSLSGKLTNWEGD
ncbi:MAG: hypothetical protein JNK48_34070 [Bryobacterales bacterium]|nr:hypothetical protein [Bryobacterales bacterium]